jgi:hydrogenase-4 component B
MLIDSLFMGALIFALLGSLLAPLIGGRAVWCNRLSSVTLALAAVMGILTGILVMLDGGFHIFVVGSTLFGQTFFSISFTVDAIQGFFLLTVSILVLAVAIYINGYNQRYLGQYDPGIIGGLLNLFYLAMVCSICADNVIFFLLSWEVLSLCSYLLIVYECRKDGVGNGGLFYLVMTHAGTGLIMAAFLLMSWYSGSYDFSSMGQVGQVMPDTMRSFAFLAFLLGFGAKAGMVPLQVWMPYAYKVAPSSVAALLSGATVKIALLMMIRGFFEFLGVQDTWWGLLVLSLACISALLGVLYANMENDLKKLLAYSSVENVGIMLMALGASMIFLTYPGLEMLSALAMIALLFHIFNHAMFKGLLFLSVGSVEMATGETDIEKLGGLAKKMPYTSALFLVGALSISAIPPFNGFVSEWLIFQTLLQSFQISDMSVKIIMPISIAVLALTGALATAAFVRAFGVTFLGRSRSQMSAQARESPRSMLLGMGILAAVCAGAGVLSVLLIPIIDNASASVLGISAAHLIVDGWIIAPTSSSFSEVSPLMLVVLMAICLPLIFITIGLYGGRRRTERGDTWDGGTPLTAKNEYSSTGFSQPIVRVFSTIYRPQSEVQTEFTSSPYVKKKVAYNNRLVPVFEKYLYRPFIQLSLGSARRFSRIQAGSLQAYLAYIFILLVLFLVIFR